MQTTGKFVVTEQPRSWVPTPDRRLMCIILVMPWLLVACATLPQAHRTEPPNVVVRNSTGQNLISVKVQEAPQATGQTQRLGSISPLLAGREFSVQRQTHSAQLADDVLVVWEAQPGHPQSKVVSIRDAIRAATGAPNETLVFQILPGGIVAVSVEFPDGRKQ